MHVSAAKYQRYELEDPDAWFEELCTEAEARWWMRCSSKEGQDVYILTGLLTMQDGVVEVVSCSTSELKKRALERERTPTFEKERYVSSSEVSYRTTEEAIFAISYQRIKVRTIRKIPGVIAENYREWSKRWSRAKRLLPRIGRARRKHATDFNLWGSEESILSIGDSRKDSEEQDTLAPYAADLSLYDLATASSTLPQTDLNAWSSEDALSIHPLEQPTSPSYNLRLISHLTTSLLPYPSSTLLPHIDTTPLDFSTWQTEEGLSIHPWEQPNLLLSHIDLSTWQTQEVVLSTQSLEEPTQSSKESTKSMEEKPNAAAPEMFPAPTEEAINAWLPERSLEISAGATEHVVLENSGESLPKIPAIKGLLMIGDPIQRLEVTLRSLYTHASLLEHNFGHLTR